MAFPKIWDESKEFEHWSQEERLNFGENLIWELQHGNFVGTAALSSCDVPTDEPIQEQTTAEESVLHDDNEDKDRDAGELVGETGSQESNSADVVEADVEHVAVNDDQVLDVSGESMYRGKAPLW